MSRYAGGANKNIGDAFLLVWTVGDEELKDAQAHGQALTPEEVEAVLETQLVDNALYAFMKIIVDIENSNKHGDLAEYGTHAKLLERFPSGFTVRMGFGLHHGWAIEGVVTVMLACSCCSGDEFTCFTLRVLFCVAYRHDRLEVQD